MLRRSLLPSSALPLGLLLAGFLAPLAAQSGGGGALREELAVRRVVWPVFVHARKAKHAESCLDLSAESVRVTEDGEEVPTTHLDRERRPTLHALLIDTSGSMAEQGRLVQARSAAKQYVDRLRPDESVIVLSFDDLMIQRAPFTRMAADGATERIHEAIDSITDPTGATFLRDALNQLILHLESYPERKVIVVLTDGDDTMSKLSTSRVLGTAASTPRQNVTIFTVGVQLGGFDLVIVMPGGVRRRHPSGSTYGRRFLEELAAVTGGRFYDLDEPAQIAETFADVRDRLARESYLTWIPAPFGAGPDDPADAPYTFRDVKVKSLDRRCRVENPREQRYAAREQEHSGADAVPLAEPTLPAQRILPVGRHWRIHGSEPFALHAEEHRMHGTFVDLVQDWGAFIRPGAAMPDWRDPHDAAFSVREFEVVVPPFESLAEGRLARPEDIPLFWLINEIRPPAGGERSAHLVHGSTFLELRESLADALYDYYPDYRAWCHEQLVDSLGRHLRYRMPDRDEATLEMLLEARLQQPAAEEIGLHLATWLDDVRAVDLAEALERRVIEFLLGTPAAQHASIRALAERVEQRWGDLRKWFPDDSFVRVLTPLVPLLDAERGEIGFVRVILPRGNRRGPSEAVPRRALALRTLLSVLAHDETRDELLARRWRMTELEDGVERWVLDQPDSDVPVTRMRGWIRIGLESAGDPAEQATLALRFDADDDTWPPLCVLEPSGDALLDRALQQSTELAACAPREPTAGSTSP